MLAHPLLQARSLVRFAIALTTILSALSPAVAQVPRPPVHAGSNVAPQGPQKELLDLVNLERNRAQLPPLSWDAGLARAAQAHATAMADAHELTHQLPGEPSLPARLSAATTLRLDGEGENVALDVTIEGAHRGLLHSPPHRANILDAQFNYAGFAAVWNHGQLWVVEDFAHALPHYTTAAVEDQIASAIAKERDAAKLPALRQVHLEGLDGIACDMAGADSLQTPATRELATKYSVMTYTQSNPSMLPRQKLIQRADITKFSVAVCFSRSQTYSTGVYWVVALFY